MGVHDERRHVMAESNPGKLTLEVLSGNQRALRRRIP